MTGVLGLSFGFGRCDVICCFVKEGLKTYYPGSLSFSGNVWQESSWFGLQKQDTRSSKPPDQSHKESLVMLVFGQIHK